MNLKLITQLVGRTHRSKLRAYIRGFALLKDTDQLGLIRQIGAELSDTRFSTVDEYAEKCIFGAGHLQSERITRQYLLQRHAGAALNKAILHSLARKSVGTVYPLPGVWQDVLTKHGVTVDQRRSSLLWAMLVLLHWGNGLFTTTKLAAKFIWTSMRHSVATPNRYAYFEGLTQANLPQPDLDGHSYDICTWYSLLNGRATDLEAICHSVHGSKTMILGGLRVEYISPPFQLLRGLTCVIRFVVWGGKAIAISAIDALRGRWAHALLLAEAAKAKAVQLCDPRLLATDYLFHYSGSIYRPMWTYEAETKGSRIICYFYSTSEHVKLPEGYVSQRYVWGAASWPTYFVWDDYQADLIRRDIDEKANVEIVGPIWFSTSSAYLPEFPEKTIAVFDVQPHRRSSHFGFSTLAEYFAENPNLNIQFLQDVHTVFSEYGVTMAFKKKREIGNMGEKKYKKNMQQLSQSGNVVLIDPNISAIKVIERCKGIISMPFTSTALYLRDRGIPSAYYDPTGWIQRDDRGAHGIQILSGIEELRDWVETLVTESGRIDE